MTTINWTSAEDQLVTVATHAIRAFSGEHSDLECCYFAFDSDPQYGYVLLCFDTTSNSRKSAQNREQSAIERRTRMLTREGAWEHAKYNLCHPTLAPFGDNTGDFAFISYREVTFPEWQQFAESPEYPAEKENTNDYLDGHFRILVWKVIERLVSEGAFDCLRKSSPFLIGYGIHDQEMSVVRMLNW